MAGENAENFHPKLCGLCVLFGELSRRPGKAAAAKKMEVNVKDGLARVRAAVEDQPVAALREALDTSHLIGSQHQPANQVGIPRLKIVHPRKVAVGDN